MTKTPLIGTPSPAVRPADSLTVTDADPAELVRDLKRQPGRDIWLCGGGELATQLVGEIDRLVLKRSPVLFGSGIPLFAPGIYAPTRFDGVNSRDLESGVSLVEYRRR